MKRLFDGTYRVDTTRAAFCNYQTGDYFVTICTKQPKLPFGKIVWDQYGNASVALSLEGCIAHECLLTIGEHYPYAYLVCAEVMPDHVHAIIRLTPDEVQPKRGWPPPTHPQTIPRAGSGRIQICRHKGN